MATTALVLLLLAVLVALGRPPAPRTVRDLAAAASRGAVVLNRLSDRRRERLEGHRTTSGSSKCAVPQHERLATAVCER